MKTSLDQLTVIHSDMLQSIMDMDIQLRQWEKKHGKVNEEQRQRVKVLQESVDTFEMMLGSLVLYWRNNLVLQQRNIELSVRNTQLEAENQTLKATLLNLNAE